MPQLSLLSLLLAAAIGLTAQVIPDSNRVDWSNAGIREAIPSTINFRNVEDYGAVGDGIANDFSAIVNALSGLNGQMTVVFFPAGTYLVSGTINLPDNVRLRGSGSDSTFIQFDQNGFAVNGFSIFGSALSTFSPIAGGLTKGSDSILVSSSLNLQEGDYLEIQQDNGMWDVNPAVWATASVGQMVRVVAVNGNQIRLDQQIRLDYDPFLNPVVRKIDMKEFVGIECMHIERLDDAITGAGYNVQFNLAANCWMTGVESARSVGSHVMISSSTNISITGNYIHHAFDYTGSATRGYGVTLSKHAGLCLVENNIFKFLRHAMMVKEGANGNVFAYNYSREPNRSELFSDFSGDISLHGHYPFANLFEGNIVQNIIIDHYWGPSGYGNSFLRNRAELYGIIVTTANPQTMNQNFIGNEATGLGYYTTGNSSHYEYGNNIANTIVPPGTDSMDLLSLLCPSVPPYWGASAPWPSIGSPNQPGQHSNPAKDRYFSNGVRTDCSAPAIRCGNICPRPDSITTDLLSNSAVRLHWKTSSYGTGYEIRGKAAGSSTWIYLIVNCDTCQFFQVNNLDPDATYVWQVRTACDTSLSDWSIPDTFRISDLFNCNPPQIKPESNLTATGVTLAWSHVASAQQYLIVGRVQGTSNIASLNVSGNDTSYTIHNLMPSTVYEYTVSAICDPLGMVQSGFADVDSFTTLSFPSQFASGNKDSYPVQNRLLIYPNPASGFVQFELTGNTPEPAELFIYNLQGVLMRKVSIENRVIQVKTGAFAVGTYFVRWGTSGNYCQKVLITH